VAKTRAIRLKDEEKKLTEILETIRGSREYKRLEDEEALGWPAAVTELDVEIFEKRLAKIRDMEQKANTKVLEAHAARELAKQERDAALGARLAAAGAVRDREAHRLATADGLKWARILEPNRNPRFALPSSDRQMPQLVDANEDTVQPDPPEDKQSDYDFEEARRPGGAAEQFYDHNAIDHGISGVKLSRIMICD
jgi:hypothetical protein